MHISNPYTCPFTSQTDSRFHSCFHVFKRRTLRLTIPAKCNCSFIRINFTFNNIIITKLFCICYRISLGSCLRVRVAGRRGLKKGAGVGPGVGGRSQEIHIRSGDKKYSTGRKRDISPDAGQTDGSVVLSSHCGATCIGDWTRTNNQQKTTNKRSFAKESTTPLKRRRFGCARG